jgi:hypothetical protein
MENMTEIKNLEEITVGKEYLGEKVIKNEDGIIQTVKQKKFDGSLIYQLNLYKLYGKTLVYNNTENISEELYNIYLNIIKKNTN